MDLESVEGHLAIRIVLHRRCTTEQSTCARRCVCARARATLWRAALYIYHDESRTHQQCKQRVRIRLIIATFVWRFHSFLSGLSKLADDRQPPDGHARSNALLLRQGGHCSGSGWHRSTSEHGARAVQYQARDCRYLNQCQCADHQRESSQRPSSPVPTLPSLALRPRRGYQTE